jgi:carboxyl-terminal processing protease
MKQKLILVCLILFGSMTPFIQAQNSNYQVNTTKMNQVLRSINDLYVDTVDFNKLTESAIVEMLKELDPHSAYLSAKESKQASEPLQGSFDGIGVTFQLIKDTINVMEVLVGGPSEKVGLMAGDKIIKVDTLVSTGKTINNLWVQTNLRGTKGSKVKILVKRGHNPEPLEFTITRGKIPMNSINVYFMANENTGYIRLERFAATSQAEFDTAVTKLKALGMKNLIFDLRGNGGGYLNVAFAIADEFIKNGQMIVYTDNFRKTGENFLATKFGNFEEGKLIILVDEGSASASEIVSGAIQDWDRGLIMGRRTFGKGLVQKPLILTDKSELRLTISHYYTPTGRCIQKPYDDGIDSYQQDLIERYKHGEYLTPDSIFFPDSLKYYTPNKRVVYGGGGIMPDIFIPMDTTKYSSLFNELVRKGVFGGFTLDYMDSHRPELLAKYPTISEFKNNFQISDEMYTQLMDYAQKEGVNDSVPFNFTSRLNYFIKDEKNKLDSLYSTVEDLNNSKEFDEMLFKYMKESYSESQKLRNLDKAPVFIKEYLKFEIARNLFSYGEAYQIFLLSDDAFLQATKLIQDDKTFKKFKVAH